MAFVSVTRLRLRSVRYLPLFLFDSVQSLEQAKQAPGNFKAVIRAQWGFVFWTMTVWESEAAMRSYMRSGAHGKSMPKLQTWCDEGAIVHWHQDTTELPSWETAEAKMLVNGRLTPLKYPSLAHQQKQIHL